MKKHLLILALLAGAALAAESPFDSAPLLAFIRQSVAAGDYYRAVTECKRFRSFYPATAPVEETHYLEALADYLGRDYPAAAQKCADRLAALPAGDDQLRYRLLAGHTAMASGRTYEAMRAFEAAEQTGGGATAAVLACVASTMAGMKELAQRKAAWLRERYPVAVNDPAVQRLLALANESVPEKSLSMVLLISLIIPGFGHAANGDWGTAALSFVSCLVMGTVTVLAAVTGLFPYAVLAGVVTAGFYGNNLSQALAKTIEANERDVQEHRQRTMLACQTYAAPVVPR